MRNFRIAALVVVLAGARLASLAAQSDPLALGIAAMERQDPAEARGFLEEAVARDSLSYAANWRLAVTLVNLGKVTPDSVRSPARDTLYAHAVTYARRAVAANGSDAEGHFALAMALGRRSLTQGSRERVRMAKEIRAEALEALRLDPTHDGACHVLGRWNAEIMRLSGMSRFFAKTFLGAGIFNQASWDEAERYLELAVRYDPARIYHRLDLALVLADRKKWAAAQAQVDTLLTLPLADPMDPEYLRQARHLEETIMGKQR